MPTLEAPSLLTTEQAAELLDVSPGTLVAWRHHKRYPLRFRRIGRNIRYVRSDVLEFLDRQADGAETVEP